MMNSLILKNKGIKKLVVILRNSTIDMYCRMMVRSNLSNQNLQQANKRLKTQPLVRLCIHFKRHTMRLHFFFTAMMTLLLGCAPDDVALAPELQGTWKLEAMYMDPGDGSGAYMPVDSDRTLDVKASGEVKSNGDLCRMSTESNGTTTGVLSTSTQQLEISQCQSSFPIRYALINDYLYLYYPCIEGCGMRFVKIAS